MSVLLHFYNRFMTRLRNLGYCNGEHRDRSIRSAATAATAKNGAAFRATSTFHFLLYRDSLCLNLILRLNVLKSLIRSIN